jgi:hypothetical protein
MEKFKIALMSGGPQYPETDRDWFKIPFTLLSVAKKNSGKTASLSQFLHIQHRMGLLDRLIMVTPTWANNAFYFKGLPIDIENDIIQPTLESSDEIIKRVQQDADEYDEYHKKMKKWNELQKFLKSKKNLNDIDEELLAYFGDEMKKPEHKYGGRKPVTVAFFDDCQGSPAFSTKSSISWLTIRHRHIGLTESSGSIGVNLMFSVQSYRSSSSGIPLSVRSNCTIMCVFKNKNQKELDTISLECSGEVSPETFLKLHEKACSKPFGFLTIDFTPKTNHPSMFRECWDTWLIPEN